MAETEEENKFEVKYTSFKAFSRQKLLSLNTLADVERELPALVNILDTMTKELIDGCMNTSESLHSKLDDMPYICSKHKDTMYNLFVRTGMRIIYILKQMEYIKESDLQLIKKMMSTVYEDAEEYCVMGVIVEIFNAKNNCIDEMIKDDKEYRAIYKEVTA